MKIKIETKPIPAPRPRVTRFGTYNKKEYTDYKMVIALAYKANNGVLHTSAVDLLLEFQYQIPKSWSKDKKLNAGDFIPRADIDNLVKGVMDALNGIAYKDDRQVQKIVASKRYGEKDLVIVGIKDA